MPRRSIGLSYQDCLESAEKPGLRRGITRRILKSPGASAASAAFRLTSPAVRIESRMGQRCQDSARLRVKLTARYHAVAAGVRGCRQSLFVNVLTEGDDGQWIRRRLSTQLPHHIGHVESGKRKVDEDQSRLISRDTFQERCHAGNRAERCVGLPRRPGGVRGDHQIGG